MTKPIPLCSALCVQRILVVVGGVFDKSLDLMLKGLPFKGRDFWDIQRQALDNISIRALLL